MDRRRPVIIMAGACGNRTHLPHPSVQDNGFEVRGAHQGPMRPRPFHNVARVKKKIKRFVPASFTRYVHPAEQNERK